MDKLYEYHREEPLSLLEHLQIEFHLIFCSRCAGEYKKLEKVREIIKIDFFFAPPSGLEERVMAEIEQEALRENISTAAGVPFYSWVITGFIVLISLATASLGMDFSKLADALGTSFLLPVGITIGAIITGYGALFIGSHLEELSERFGLRHG
jgi:hypothetical protein